MGNDCPEIAVGVSHYDHQRQAIFLRKRNKDIFLIRILHQQMKPLHHFF
jgi:toxin ParE1/3/4